VGCVCLLVCASAAKQGAAATVGGRAASAKRSAAANAANGTFQGLSVSAGDIGESDDEGEEEDDDDYDSDEAARAFLKKEKHMETSEGRGMGIGGEVGAVAAPQGEADESERQAARALLEGLRQRAKTEAEDKVMEHFSRPGTARSRPGTACSPAGTI
jgi:hypothetical protein